MPVSDVIVQKALLWWEFLPFEVVCARALPGHHHSSLVPTGIRGPGAQGKLEAKHDAKPGAPCLGEREKTTLLPHKYRMRGMCLQGVDGHRSPGSLQLFVPVVPQFCCATCTRALFKFYFRDLQFVNSKATFPLSEGSSCVRGGPWCSTSVTGGRLVSSPADRNALAGARVAAHTAAEALLCLVIVQGERNWESLCLSLQELDLMILLYHPQHHGTA